jgi:L-arabinose isomerase
MYGDEILRQVAGQSREHLTDLAEIIGVELLIIDADTPVGQFGKEMRWNRRTTA